MMRVYINGSQAWRTENSHTTNTPGMICLHMHLERGDYIELRGTGANMGNSDTYPMSHYHIVKV